MKRKDYIILIIIVTVMAILVLMERIAIPCIFNKVTGLYCPGCGITRAIRTALKGNFKESIHNNLLLYTLVPLLIITEIIYRLTNRKYKKMYNIMLIFLLICALIFGILRNFPQFSFLAPIEY
jgi:hypothetical protein